jgi:Zn-dependent protease
MDVRELGMGLLWYAVFVVSTTFHEAAHGFAALRLGDPTARNAGLVTLDPAPHIRRSPVGMVVVPLVSFLVGGWMVGWASTPYDPYWARAHRRRAALMALAGPAANLVLLHVAAGIIRAGLFFEVFARPASLTAGPVTVASSPGWASGAAVVVGILLSLNLILLVFNLLPVPPLDGSEVLSLFLRAGTAQRYRELMAQPAAALVGLVLAWNLVDYVLAPAFHLTLYILYSGL